MNGRSACAAATKTKQNASHFENLGEVFFSCDEMAPVGGGGWELFGGMINFYNGTADVPLSAFVEPVFLTI